MSISVNESWFAPNSGATTRPVTLKISPSVTGVVPYHGLGPTNAFGGSGTITLKGHPDVILGSGGDRRLGNSSMDAGKIEDIIIEDVNFYAGIFPIANPTAAQNDSRSGTNQMPFYGAAQPAEGWGQTFQNRDALHVYHTERLILRHCTFAYGIDEALEMFRSPGSNNRVIRDVLVENCFIGLSLRNATDRGIPHGETPHPLHDPAAFPPHNFGGLIADGDPNDPSKVQNIVFRNCVFASNDRRSPNPGIANGITVDNCLIVHWGREGMVIRNPSSSISVPCPTTMMFRNNLFQPGPFSRAGYEIGVIRCGTTATKLYIPGNYIISPGDQGNWTNDVLLDPADVHLQPSSGAASNPATIVSTPPYETPYTSELMPTDTPQQRKALYEKILSQVGPRWRGTNGDPLTGDTNTSYLLQWALPKVRNGSLPHITFPEDATGYDISEPTVLLHNDFEDGNATAWTTIGGAWTVTNDGTKAYSQTTTAPQAAIACAGDTSWTDYLVQANVKLTSTGSDLSAGILFRYTDSSNFYMLGLRTSSNVIELYKNVGGSMALVASQALVVNTGQFYTLKAEVRGNTIRGCVNGLPMISWTNSVSELLAGEIGLRTFGAAANIDEVKVIQLNPPPATFARTSALVNAYAEAGTASRRQQHRLLTHLSVAQRLAGADQPSAAKYSLDRFDEIVGDISDEPARDNLLAMSNSLRSTL